MERENIPQEELLAQDTTPMKSGSFWRLGSSFPNIADLFIIYGVFVLSQLLGQSIAHILGVNYDASLLSSSDEELRYSAQYAYGLYSMVTYGSAMVLTSIFVVLYKYLRGDKGRLLHFSSGRNSSNLILWGVLMILSVSVILEPLIKIMPNVPQFPGRGVPAIISLVVIAPIFEEFICRGVILEALRRRGGVLFALLISSLFFALLHVHITLVVNSFVMGLILGYFYLRTNSLLVVIMLHAINNTIAYILLYTNYSDLALSDIILNPRIYYIVYGVAVALLLLSMVKVTLRLRTISKSSQ